MPGKQDITNEVGTSSPRPSYLMRNNKINRT
nr:MAG TPA: hypothetical protein [Caudoviricetes sp.]